MMRQIGVVRPFRARERNEPVPGEAFMADIACAREEGQGCVKGRAPGPMANPKVTARVPALFPPASRPRMREPARTGFSADIAHAREGSREFLQSLKRGRAISLRIARARARSA